MNQTSLSKTFFADVSISHKIPNCDNVGGFCSSDFDNFMTYLSIPSDENKNVMNNILSSQKSYKDINNFLITKQNSIHKHTKTLISLSKIMMPLTKLQQLNLHRGSVWGGTSDCKIPSG